MKILLVTLDSKFIHANLAVRYLKKYCIDMENEDLSIEIKEFTVNQKHEYILSEILSSNADLICFSCYVWNIEYIKELAYIIKEARNNIEILCGGPEVSFEIETFMKNEPYIDYVIYGEGELTFREFIKEYGCNAPNFQQIRGLAYRDGGKVIVNQHREPIHNLDIINYPYDENDSFEDKIIYYESSRGCPFSCSFCMSSIDKKMRTFSMERVKNDLEMLLNTKARQIKFVDRTFNADSKRAMDIMDFIKEHNKNNMTIHFEITADIINDEFLNYISRLPVNMFQFEIGIQTLNDNTLSEINRRMNLEKINHVISSIVGSRNVHIHLDLIAGLPYEDYKSFKKSFDGIHKLNAEKIQLGFLKVLKGTKIYDDVEKHCIKYRKTSPYEVICTKYISVDELLRLKNIEELVERYYNEKYFVKSLEYILTNIFTESPFDFYEDFSHYWQNHDLYRMSHSRKSLYKILYDYIIYSNKMTDEFLWSLKFDYVFNNQFEDLPDYLERNSEDKFKAIKRALAYSESFKDRYLNEGNRERTINEFRLVEIGNDVVLFLYGDKENIFNRCQTFIINDLIEEMENEQKG
jgi:radical SAM superfamily enzyme YgiQ (UPF0313 family)